MFLDLGTHGVADLAIEYALVAKQLVEGTCTHGLTERELELLVDELHEVGQVRASLHGIRHLPKRRQVHTQADLVTSQDFLTRDLHGLHAPVDQLDLHRALVLPERMQSRLEHLRKLAVYDQQPIAVSGTSVAVTASDACAASGCLARTRIFARALGISNSFEMS